MADAPCLGTGYSMLPLWPIVMEGKLPLFPDAALAVYVVLSAHANRETDLAHPGFLRIARLAGISKSDVGGALRWLAANHWITVEPGGRNFIYRLRGLEHRFAQKVAVPLRQRIVFSGLWAECPNSAKRVFMVLLVRSRPGRPGDLDDAGSNYAEAFGEVRGSGGYRHLPLERSDSGYLASLAGLPRRTFSHAMATLDKLGLTEVYEESGELLLPNTPQKISLRVLESLRDAVEKDQARSASRGARISAGKRRSKKFGKS